VNEPVHQLGREYQSALESYLESRDEPALNHAYELGRRAMIDGLGVLDMAVLHRAAIEALVLPASFEDQSTFAAAAADFFHELLSPFEMSYRGYRDANDDLRRLNEALREQKESLEVANHELESFSYSVSHDLRAPLRAIDAFARIVIEDYADKLDGEGHKRLLGIHEAAQRMAQLIDDLLRLSRVTRTEIHRVDADITAIARRIATRLADGEPARTCRFVIDDGIRGKADPRLLALALENLIGNAWKFTSKRDDAVISIGVQEREGIVTYFVRDNGAGFDMAHGARLFGAFQRLHTTQEFEGTGIGLAIVQRVIHRHDGKVWAEGKVGGGACFYFTLGGGRGRLR